MRYQPFFQTLISCRNADEVFEFLMDNLSESIVGWDYFVGWETVFGHISEIEMDLNTMDYLIGKEDVESAFKALLRMNARLVRIIPILIACRDLDFKVLMAYSTGELKYESYSFDPTSTLTENAIDKVTHFARETGILGLFRDRKIKSIPDYVLGVEVGLDSNGRKNRSGKAMESLVLSLTKAICDEYGFDILTQLNAKKAKAEWGINLPVDKSSRNYDFGVRTRNGVYLIETNYYGGGGSKLKATAGEYKGLNDLLNSKGFNFIWITDGKGWETARAPLAEAFHHNEYTLNLKMVMKGILKEILV